MRNRTIIITNLIVVLFLSAAVFLYGYRTSGAMKDKAYTAFMNTAYSMQEVAASYMYGEQVLADSWANHINSEGMTMKQAIDYANSSKVSEEEAVHIIWADDFAGLSTDVSPLDANDHSVVYRDIESAAFDYHKSLENHISELDFDKKVVMTSSYSNPQNGELSVAFCSKISLLSRGKARDAYLLRVIPQKHILNEWNFVTEYPAAEVALIESDGTYITRPKSMKNGNFFEYLFSYNRIDPNYMKEVLTDNTLGYFTANDSKGVENVYAYSQMQNTVACMAIVAIPKNILIEKRSDMAMVWNILIILGILLVLDVSYFIGAHAKEHHAAETIRCQLETIETQKRQLQAALLASQKANNAKTIFLNNMSHDIRTPMNAIIGFAKLAQGHLNDANVMQDYLQKIDVSSEHLLKLINDVLDMSRIESGKIALEKSDESLLDVFTELKTIVQGNANKKHINLNINIDESINDKVICDRLRLEQVLLNLLGNAIKFTPEDGKVSLSVKELESEKENHSIYEFTVSDSGIGMSEEFLPHLFEPFERERTSTVSGIQGTGLGMTISKNIVEMMGGTISATSVQGKGSEFKVVLELEHSSINKDVNNEPAAQEHDFTGKKILLAEDNELNQEIAVEILEDAGFEIEVVDDGMKAVERMEKATAGEIDVILMDIQMPNMDGYEATRRIRKLDNADIASVPIVAMTANAFERDKEIAAEAGMDGYIPKPIDIPKLYHELERILGNK